MNRNVSDEYRKFGHLLQLDRQHFREIYPLLKRQRLKKNEFFLRAGDQCRYYGFVVSGAMRSYYETEDGDDVTFKFHFDDYFFTNFESLILNIPSRLNIVAIQKTELLILHKNDLSCLFEKGSFWQAFGRSMIESMYLETIIRVEHFIYLNHENRYKRLLQEKPDILEKVPKRHIASFLGITPQSLSRIRKRIGDS